MLSKEINSINGVIKLIYQAIKKDLDHYDLTRDCSITSIEFQPSTKHVIVYLFDDTQKLPIQWTYTYDVFANLPLK